MCAVYHRYEITPALNYLKVYYANKHLRNLIDLWRTHLTIKGDKEAETAKKNIKNMAAQQSVASGSEEIEGSLSYWTTVVNKWQNRWCVLKEDGYLYYYAVSIISSELDSLIVSILCMH